MAIKFVFEDGDNTPSSILLKSGYHGSNIYFSGGCGMLYDKACSIQEPGDIVYMFYDVSPNYQKTVDGYNEVIRIIRQDNIKDMYVIPIICIEYHIWKMLYKYNYITMVGKNKDVFIDNLVKDFNWQKLMSYNLNLTTYVTESLEHMYKNLFKDVRQCQKNTFNYRNGVRDVSSPLGRFYVVDCNCNRSECKIDCTDNLLLKAERLYTELPIIAVESEEHKEYLKNMGICCKGITLSDIRKERQEFYDKICNSMNINGINIVI